MPVRRQRRRLAVTLALAACAAAWPGAAQTALSGERGTPLVPIADTVPAGEFSLSAAASVAGAMPGDRFHAAPFGLTLGLWNRLEGGVTLHAMPRGLPESRGVEQDLRVSLKALLLTEYIARPAIAVALAADHPLQGWDFLPAVITHKHVGPLLLTAQAGWRLPHGPRDDDPAGPFYGAAAALAMSPSTTFMFQAAGDAGRGFANLKLMPGISFSLLGPDPLEARRKALRLKALEVARAILGDIPAPGVDVSLPRAAVADQGPPAWTGVGLFNSARSASLQHPGRITFFATGGVALGSRATWSVFAGVQIASFDELLVDSDGDGIPDRFDKCPYEPEDWDGYEDEDGCPDHGAEVLKKYVEEVRRKAATRGVRFTTPQPRYRLKIPIRPIPTAPAPGDPREADPPRPAPAAPAPPAAPPPAPAPVPASKAPRRPAPARRLAAATPAKSAVRPAAAPSAAERTGPISGPESKTAPKATSAPVPKAAAPARVPAQPAPERSLLPSAALWTSPVVPLPLVEWPGRVGAVRDALALPRSGAASSSLPPRLREGLAQFAARALEGGLGLEVWDCASTSQGLEVAELQARETLLLASFLAGLPAGAGRAHAAVCPRVRGAVVLLVSPARGP